MLNTKGRSFVTIMIVVAITALILRFGIENLIKINIAKNEADAQSVLKLISAALENYAKDNKGAYPDKLSLLTQGRPAYLDKNYASPSVFMKSYGYSCLRLEPIGYSCSAAPSVCNFTGRNIFTVTTGGLLVSENCMEKSAK